MEDLFRQFWWLLFPLTWFVMAGFASLLRYRRHRDAIDLMKSYVQSGKEPPAELLAVLNRTSCNDFDGLRSKGSGGGSRWPMVVLFACLAAGFSFAAFQDMYGAGQAFTIVALVMGALAAAHLVGAVMASRALPQQR